MNDDTLSGWEKFSTLLTTVMMATISLTTAYKGMLAPALNAASRAIIKQTALKTIKKGVDEDELANLREEVIKRLKAAGATEAQADATWKEIAAKKAEQTTDGTTNPKGKTNFFGKLFKKGGTKDGGADDVGGATKGLGSSLGSFALAAAGIAIAVGAIALAVNQFNKADNLMLKHTDIFVCDGSERQEFYPLFCYHGFRYVKIENAPENIEVYAENAHTDLERIGSFECNDEMLNSIHSATVRSVLTNYHGMPTDCPHREQNGWTGDAQLSSEAALMNFDMVSAYEKWMNDFKDMQRPNGQLPGVIPSADWGYNFGSGPAWDSALFIIPWTVYKFTGDISLIKSMWQNMLTYMDYMSRQADDYICDYGLADWCSPIDRPQHPAVVTDTAYYYHDAVLMSKMAELMGEPSDK
jgi:alpha-L-rhamnosidase